MERRLGNLCFSTAKRGKINAAMRVREPRGFVRSISCTRFDTHIVTFSRLRLRVPHYIRHQGTSPSRCSAWPGFPGKRLSSICTWALHKYRERKHEWDSRRMEVGPVNRACRSDFTVADVSWHWMVTCFHSRGFLFFTEYATVGYMAKRIQMRKNRFQKIAESMKAASENPGPRVPGDHGDHAPKQTVSSDGQIVVVHEFLSSMQNVVLSPRVWPGDPDVLELPWAILHAFFQQVDDRICQDVQMSRSWHNYRFMHNRSTCFIILWLPRAVWCFISIHIQQISSVLPMSTTKNVSIKNFILNNKKFKQWHNTEWCAIIVIQNFFLIYDSQRIFNKQR